MRPRQSLIDIFSTFIEFQSDAFSRWVIDVRLRRSIKHQLVEDDGPQISEKFLAHYWYLAWKTQDLAEGGSLARGHLSAYLQETCYWAAIKICKALPRGSYRVSDCFQIAVAEIDKILTGYDAQRGASLRSYANLVYPRVLRDIFRQRKEAEISTNWTLLRRVSKRVLIEALQQSGRSPQDIACYRLAWVCFKAVSQGNRHQGVDHARVQSSQAPEPSKFSEQSSESSPVATKATVDWHRIATLYNAEQQYQLDAPGVDVDAATVEQWLSGCAGCVRTYLYPTIASLNVSQSNRDSEEWQDAIAVPLKDSLLNELIEVEDSYHRQIQSSQVNQVLINAISALNADQQTLLHLYYSEKLTQQHIAQQIGIKQYAVSRRLRRTRESLLMNVMQWSQDTLHITPNPDLVRTMSTVLEEWLNTYYESTNTSPNNSSDIASA